MSRRSSQRDPHKQIDTPTQSLHRLGSVFSEIAARTARGLSNSRIVTVQDNGALRARFWANGADCSMHMSLGDRREPSELLALSVIYKQLLLLVFCSSTSTWYVFPTPPTLVCPTNLGLPSKPHLTFSPTVLPKAVIIKAPHKAATTTRDLHKEATTNNNSSQCTSSNLLRKAVAVDAARPAAVVLLLFFAAAALKRAWAAKLENHPPKVRNVCIAQ